MNTRQGPRIRTFLICLFASAMAATAVAQPEAPQPVTGARSTPTPIDEAREGARLHGGPLYLTPTVQVKEFGIDSNVFNVYGERTQSDFTTTVAPKLDVALPVSKRALFQAITAADLVWYSKYATERSVDPRVDLRGRLFLHRITLFGGGSYLNSRQRPNQEIDVRARRVEESASAGVEVALTPEISVSIAGNGVRTRYDETAEYDNTLLRRTLDRDTEGIELKTKYRLSPLTSLAVRYDRLRDSFPLSPARDSDSFRVMPGVEFKPRALISGSAYVGYRAFTPSLPAVLPEFNGLVAQLGLSYTLLGATAFGVSYSRDLTYSYEELQPFFVDDSIGASVRRALGRRFDVLVSADRHHYAYEDFLTNASPSFPITPRIDVTWNYAASLGYRLGRQGRIGFGASNWHRESTTRVFRTYDNLRFGSTMTFGF
jgi:hypothetical protein